MVKKCNEPREMDSQNAVTGAMGRSAEEPESGHADPSEPMRSLAETVASNGFAFVHADALRRMIEASGSIEDWSRFAASWNDLALDGYMADGGRYRRRRHAVYSVTREGLIERKAHQPHYQSLDYNRLNGGVARWFEPVDAVIGDGASLNTILAFCRTLFGLRSPDVPRWHVEVHQFRIEARPGQLGQPTPEGLHRDGVDHVLVLLVARRNIAQGTTTIHDLDRRLLGSFTLTDPFDAAIVDDARVYHGVTAVEPIDPASAAYRDVLVVTFRAGLPSSSDA